MAVPQPPVGGSQTPGQPVNPVAPTVQATKKSAIQQVVPVQMNGKTYYTMIYINGKRAGFPQGDAGALAKKIQGTMGTIVGSVQTPPGTTTTGFDIDFKSGQVVFHTTTETQQRTWRRLGLKKTITTERKELAYTVDQTKAAQPAGDRRLGARDHNVAGEGYRQLELHVRTQKLYTSRIHLDADTPPPRVDTLAATKEHIANVRTAFTAAAPDISVEDRYLSEDMLDTSMYALVHKRSKESGKPMGYQVLPAHTFKSPAKKWQRAAYAKADDVKITNPAMEPLADGQPVTKGKHILAIPVEQRGLTEEKATAFGYKLPISKKTVQHVAVVLDFDNNRIIYHDPEGRTPAAHPELNELIEQLQTRYFDQATRPQLVVANPTLGDQQAKWENGYRMLNFVEQATDPAHIDKDVGYEADVGGALDLTFTPGTDLVALGRFGEALNQVKT